MPQAVLRGDYTRELGVVVHGERLGTLFVQPSRRQAPGWISFFSDAVPNLEDIAFSSTTSAVLLVIRGEYTFAIAFGYGRHMLEPGSWEEDFGLKVTLNSVNAMRIRSVDRMTLDAIGQHSQIQASRESAISDFGLDLEQDLLRAVTGRPSETGLGQRLTGRDALQVTTDATLTDLPQLLDRLLERWQSEEYKMAFPWIDQIHEVKSQLRRKELDQTMVQRIQANDLARLWLTIPQIIDWSTIEGFKYRDARSAAVHADIHVAQFVEDLGGSDNVTFEALKRRYVSAVADDNTTVVHRWPVYRCIYCEIDADGDTYLLSNGNWYKIGAGFLDRVNAAFEQTPRAAFALPDYNDASEGAYNIRVAREHPDEYVLMDEALIRRSDTFGTIEFCDLYSRDKSIVHVKRYGGSAPLSHLFAQAVVSATLFRRDPEFRRDVNKKLPEAFQPVIPPLQRDEYEVAFAIISKSLRELTIPFFSRVNLKNARQRLEELGYRVSLLKVQA